MRKVRILIFLILNILLIASCKYKHSNNNTNQNNYSSSHSSDYDEDGYDEDGYDEDGMDENGHIKDGTYPATVDYYNPVTGYAATYTLDVEVEDGEVTVIYFPNDGYLDDDHIYPGELDDDGYVEIEGEEGKTYEVQIDY